MIKIKYKYKLLMVRKFTVLKSFTFNLLLIEIKLCIYIKCLNCKLKDSFKKKIFNLNFVDGLFRGFLKRLKKKLKYFS